MSTLDTIKVGDTKYTAKILGFIAVDSGLIWVGDPCYVLHADKLPKSLGENWVNFCNILGTKDSKQFEFDTKINGLAVVSSTLHGDGYYPVMGYFEKDNERPSGIFIDFNN